jgi:hypothetical protein
MCHSLPFPAAASAQDRVVLVVSRVDIFRRVRFKPVRGATPVSLINDGGGDYLYYDKTIEYVFSKDVVKVGQPFYVYIENLENEHNVCYDGYNHKDKHPEYVTAFLPI